MPVTQWKCVVLADIMLQLLNVSNTGEIQVVRKLLTIPIYNLMIQVIVYRITMLILIFSASAKLRNHSYLNIAYPHA